MSEIEKLPHSLRSPLAVAESENYVIQKSNTISDLNISAIKPWPTGSTMHACVFLYEWLLCTAGLLAFSAAIFINMRLGSV